MNITLVILIIFFVIGVTIGILYNHASVIVLFLGGILLFEMALFIFAKIKKLETKYIGAIFLLSLFCVFGIVRGEMYEEIQLPREFTQGKQTFLAEIISIPEATDKAQIFDVTIFSSSENKTLIDTKIRIRINAPLYPIYTVGEVVKISGIIKEPEVILPTNFETSAKTFDYKRYLHGKGIVGTMVFPSIETTGKIEQSFIYKLFSFKQKSVDIINQKIASPESDLANGVLLGTDSLPKENKDEVRVASLSHIIVLSGFNVAIIVTVVLFLLRFLPFYLRMFISSVLIAGFVVMVGGGASLIRATVMAYVGLLAMVIGRRYDALTALLLALGIYVFINPEAVLYDVSLQLSFLATLGIIILYDDVYYFVSKYVSYESVSSILSTTLSVMILTTPYLMYTFGKFSLYGIVANVFALPLVPLLMASTFVLLCTSFIPLVSHLFAFISYLLSSIILFIAHVISLLPFASVPINISITWMFILYGIILVSVWYLEWKKSLHKIKVSEIDPTLVSF